MSTLDTYGAGFYWPGAGYIINETSVVVDKRAGDVAGTDAQLSFEKADTARLARVSASAASCCLPNTVRDLLLEARGTLTEEPKRLYCARRCGPITAADLSPLDTTLVTAAVYNATGCMRKITPACAVISAATHQKPVKPIILVASNERKQELMLCPR